MFEFIQLCIKLITLFTKVATSNAPREVRLAAYDDARAMLHQHVMVMISELNRMSVTQSRLFFYWQYAVELSKDQAYAALSTGEDDVWAAGRIAMSRTQVNAWAAKLGYRVVGV